MADFQQIREFVFKSLTPLIIRRDSYDNLVKAFRTMDVSGRGKLNRDDILQVAAELGEHIDFEQAQQIVDFVDKDGDQLLSQEEFLFAL